MSPAVLLLAVVSGGLGFVGLRLLRKEDAGVPERALGIAFLAFGLGAVPRFLGAQHAGDATTSTAMTVVNIASQLLFQLGVGGFCAFTCEVFRPGSRWARNLALALFVASLVPTLVVITETGMAGETGIAAVAVNATRSLAMIWTFVECVRYAQLMRRRTKLGLADVLVANRFVLWAAWTGAFGFAPLVFLALRINTQRIVALGLDPRVEAPWTLPLAAGVGALTLLVAMVGVWLAFFPPAAYQRWVRGRA